MGINLASLALWGWMQLANKEAILTWLKELHSGMKAEIMTIIPPCLYAIAGIVVETMGQEAV